MHPYSHTYPNIVHPSSDGHESTYVRVGARTERAEELMDKEFRRTVLWFGRLLAT